MREAHRGRETFPGDVIWRQLVEWNDDVGAEGLLGGDGTFWCELEGTLVKVGSEGDSRLRDLENCGITLPPYPLLELGTLALACSREREDLKAARVCDDRTPPPHEAV